MPHQQCDYRIIFKWLSSILSLHQVKNKPKIFWASLHSLGKHGPMLARAPVPNHLTGHKQFFCFCWLLFCPAHHNTVAQKCSSKLSACSTFELTFLDYIKGGLWQLVAFQTLTWRDLVKQEDSNNEQLQRNENHVSQCGSLQRWRCYNNTTRTLTSLFPQLIFMDLPIFCSEVTTSLIAWSRRVINTPSIWRNLSLNLLTFSFYSHYILQLKSAQLSEKIL